MEDIRMRIVGPGPIRVYRSRERDFLPETFVSFEGAVAAAFRAGATSITPDDMPEGHMLWRLRILAEVAAIILQGDDVSPEDRQRAYKIRLWHGHYLWSAVEDHTDMCSLMEAVVAVQRLRGLDTTFATLMDVLEPGYMDER